MTLSGVTRDNHMTQFDPKRRVLTYLAPVILFGIPSMGVTVLLLQWFQLERPTVALCGLFAGMVVLVFWFKRVTHQNLAHEGTQDMRVAGGKPGTTETVENIVVCWEVTDLEDSGPGYAVQTEVGRAFYFAGPAIGNIDNEGDSLPVCVVLELHPKDGTVIAARGNGDRISITKRISSSHLRLPIESSFASCESFPSMFQDV